MMLFLLSQDGNDLLLIDQPEDDLDSQTVYEEVVKLLRNLKPKQQFIFATHNANFPVLGDAETITTCSASDDEIVISVGNIDDRACQASVISIMEGGPEAFERRKAIYQIWKADTADNKGQHEETIDIDGHYNDGLLKLCECGLQNYEPSFGQHDAIGVHGRMGGR